MLLKNQQQQQPQHQSPTFTTSVWRKSLSPFFPGAGDSSFSFLQQHNKNNDKLKNAYQRFEGSLDAIIDYLSRHGGINPHTLQAVKNSLQDDASSSSSSLSLSLEDGGHVGSGSSLSSSSSSSPESQSGFARTAVDALWKLHQYASCLHDRAECHVKHLLLMTAWESLSRYLQIIQRRMRQEEVQALQLAQQSPLSLIVRTSNNVSSARQALVRISEAIVTCQKEWILLNHKLQRQQQVSNP